MQKRRTIKRFYYGRISCYFNRCYESYIHIIHLTIKIIHLYICLMRIILQYYTQWRI